MFPSRIEAELLAGPVRPPILAQHSNSVPSTPRQHARERRERTPRSRTPSPRKGMGNHSPKSVYSESSGMEAQKRGCEFEPTQPLGRRRFDWTIGNDKVLPFNKPEAAPVLDAGIDQRLASEAQQLYDQLAPTEDSVERRRKFVVKLEGLLKKTWLETSFKVYLYGSSGNMLCTSESDVDICIETPNKTFEKVCYLARMFAGNGMQRVICMNFIRAVPIVKIWDPELNLACDMNVNNKVALWNTRMVKAYVRLDARVKQLALIIKYWTRRRKIHEAGPPGTLSSYTWTCMIINFLQTREPPILPPLTDDESEQAMSRDHWESAIQRLEAFEGFNAPNTESLTALLFGFFFHYGYGVDYENEVISVRLGRLIPKINKPSFTEPLCVEEPFTPHKNLSASADVFSIHGIHTELRRAFEFIRDGKLEEWCVLYQHPEVSNEPRRRVEESTSEKPRASPRPLLRRSSSQQSGRAFRMANTVRGGRSEQSPRSGLSGLRSFNVANRQQQYQTLPRTPPHGAPSTDQLGSSSNALHDQLYRDYNYLRDQQAVLEARLVQSQSAQPDRSQQQYSFVNPFGILYHYPVHYPSVHSAAQPLYQQGATTNPPSPSLSTVDPLFRRAFKRTSDNHGGLSGSLRSQSQPARFLPTNIAPQNVVSATFDVSASEGPPPIVPVPPPTATGQYYGSSPMAPSVSQGLPLRTPLREHGLQKPYYGYYLANQSHVVSNANQAVSQYRNLQLPQIPTYSDLAHHRRRVSPDTTRPINLKGLDEVPHPQSALNHVRSYSTGVQLTPLPQNQPFDTPRQMQASGPVIVNGSSLSIPLELTQRNLSQLDKQGSKLREHHNPAIHPSMFDSLWEDRDREVSSAEQTLNVNEILRWQDQPEPPTSEMVKKVNRDVPVAMPLRRTSTGSPLQHVDVTGHVNGEMDTSYSKTNSDAPPSPSDAERPMQLSLISESSAEGGRKDANQRPLGHSTLPLPMLSPVAETLTPLPGMRGFDLPRAHVTNGKQGSMTPPPPTPFSQDFKENRNSDYIPSLCSFTNKTELNGTANATAHATAYATANTTANAIANTIANATAKASASATYATADAANGTASGTANSMPQSNAWQQAGKKNKRTKANADQRSAAGIRGQGEPMPTLASERKGG